MKVAVRIEDSPITGRPIASALVLRPDGFTAAEVYWISADSEPEANTKIRKRLASIRDAISVYLDEDIHDPL